MNRFLTAVLIVVMFVGFASAQKINVGASIFPAYDWVRIIGGERVDAFVLLKPGESPHTFDLLPKDAKKISESKLFFVVGKGLETWLESYVRTSGDRAAAIVRLSEGIDKELRTIGYSEELIADPHLWLDPLAAKIMVAKIADKLCGIDPAGCNSYKENLARYDAILDELSKELKNLGSEFKGAKIVTHHNAYRQFILRTGGLELLGVVEVSPEQEPSSAHLKRLIDDMKENGVKVVFVEPQLSPREAKIIAGEVGGAVKILDPIGGVAPRDSYEKTIRYNIEVIRETLSTYWRSRGN